MKNFTQILGQTYHEAPDQVAIHLLFSRQPDRAITYRELLINAADYACALELSNVRPGEVVILILQHGEDLLSAFFGTILHGAIPSIMPFLTEKLLPDQYRSALTTLFEITAPTAIITYDDFLPEVKKAATGTSVHSILIAEQVSHEQERNSKLNFNHFQGLNSSPEDIVLLQHSSGTTGLQKGVALSHRAVFNQLENYARSLNLSPTDVVVSWLPLYHDMGLIAGFILPILRRIPLALMSPFDWVRAPYRLMQAISRYRGTLCWLPNFAYNFCAQKIRGRDLDGVDLSSWRAVINCSEPMHWESHAMFLERFQPNGLRPEALATCYAMAENVFAVTQGGIMEPVKVNDIDQQAFQERQVAVQAASGIPNSAAGQEIPTNTDSKIIRMLSAGRPIEGTQLRVLNPEGKNLPEGHIGEIALKSDCMLTGYYHRPDLTKDAFNQGWYLTGDLGYILDGELYISGRKKDLIIVGGKNIYPQDLERIVDEVQGVHPGRVAAFGIYNERSGTEDVIIIAEANLENQSDPQSEADRIAAAIRQQVTRSSDVALRYVHVVERNWLVKTSSGKVARSANREKYLGEIAAP